MIDMWYFVEKNGKAVKAYKSRERALLYAWNDLDYDSVDDCVSVADSLGNVLWEP